MNKMLKEQTGITVMALVVTIIVILILAGVGIGSATGIGGNVNQSKDAIAKTQLNKIQQALYENYIKYKQTGNERFLKGIKLSYDEALAAFNTLGSSSSLKVARYGGNESDDGIYYYKLQDWHLKEMGLENTNKDEYVANYSTGEVFNITQKKTVTGEILYVYTTNNITE